MTHLTREIAYATTIVVLLAMLVHGALEAMDTYLLADHARYPTVDRTWSDITPTPED